MGTFCHLKPERRFSYGIYEAWICHRCSGIYGAFLILSVLAMITGWSGRWTKGGHAYQPYISGAFLLALCGLQVLLQHRLEEFDVAWLRYAVGIGVGLALLQFLLGSTTLIQKPSPKNFLLCLLPVLFVHAWLSSTLYLYHLLTVLPGLLLLYLLINLKLIGMNKLNPIFRWSMVLFLVMFEWGFLHYVNVMRRVAWWWRR